MQRRPAARGDVNPLGTGRRAVRRLLSRARRPVRTHVGASLATESERTL